MMSRRKKLVLAAAACAFLAVTVVTCFLIVHLRYPVRTVAGLERDGMRMVERVPTGWRYVFDVNNEESRQLAARYFGDPQAEGPLACSLAVFDWQFVRILADDRKSGQLHWKEGSRSLRLLFQRTEYGIQVLSIWQTSSVVERILLRLSGVL